MPTACPPVMMTIQMNGDDVRKLYRLLAAKLAAGDQDAIDFMVWLDGQLGMRDENSDDAQKSSFGQ